MVRAWRNAAETAARHNPAAGDNPAWHAAIEWATTSHVTNNVTAATTRGAQTSSGAAAVSRRRDEGLHGVCGSAHPAVCTAESGRRRQRGDAESGIRRASDGTSYPAQTTLDAKAKNITVVQKSGYRPSSGQ